MSITDSREDLEAARTKVAALTTEQLRADLEYWSIAAVDDQAVARELARQYHEARGRVHEAESWATLVLEELARRPRGARREP